MLKINYKSETKRTRNRSGNKAKKENRKRGQGWKIESEYAKCCQWR